METISLFLFLLLFFISARPQRSPRLCVLRASAFPAPLRLKDISSAITFGRASMTLVQGLLLFGAAMMAGMLNSVAGGGTLVTFPALVWSGRPEIIANATSTRSEERR